MKKKQNEGMTMVRLEPIAVRLIDHVCKAEGLTREEVLATLLRRCAANKEATR